VVKRAISVNITLPLCSQGKFMNMVRSAFPLIFLRENLEVVKRAIAWKLI
jgi:hypothetical protein